MSGDHQSLLGIIAGALCCVSAFECNLAFDKYGGIVVWIGLMLYMFKALGVICDEYFVPSLEVIVDRLQLSNDVAGATFMAAGSSAPELFTSLVATFLIVNEGGVGTIVGSAIFNILVIVGATGYIACKDQSLKIWWYPLCRDCFFYTLSIVELMIILQNEVVEWYEGVLMFVTYLSYCIYMKFNPRIIQLLGLVDPAAESTVSTVEENGTQVKVTEAQAAPDADALRSAGDKPEDTTQPEVGGSVAVTVGAPAAGPTAPGIVTTEEETKETAAETKEGGTATTEATENANDKLLAAKAGAGSQLLEPQASPREKRRPSWGYAETNREEKRKTSKEGAPPSESNPPPPLCEGPAAETTKAKGWWPKWLRDPMLVFWEFTAPGPERMGGGLLFTWSIIYIGVCTYMMVDATNRVGVVLHIPPLAMALVFLAAGTSIPDALGSIAVAKQGEGDMAVANALGSNVFDILIGLGVPWTIKTGIMGKKVEFIGKWAELKYDIVVLCFVLVLFVGCLVLHKWHLTRRVGILLLLMYVGFIIYNVFAIWVIDPPLKAQAEQAFCDVL